MGIVPISSVLKCFFCFLPIAVGRDKQLLKVSFCPEYVTSEFTSDRGTYGKMSNRLDEISCEVQVTIVIIGDSTIHNGEQGESASQVCLFVPLIK